MEASTVHPLAGMFFIIAAFWSSIAAICFVTAIDIEVYGGTSYCHIHGYRLLASILCVIAVVPTFVLTCKIHPHFIWAVEYLRQLIVI